MVFRKTCFIFVSKIGVMSHKINITAQNADDFKKVEDALNELPTFIREQITDASYDSHFGVKATIGQFYFSKDERIYIPNDVTQINDREESTTIYHPKFLFTIDKKKFYNRKHYDIVLSPKEKK